MDIRIVSDEPITNNGQDQFQFGSYAKSISRAVLSSSGAYTLGVMGGWGTGKTSLMNLIRQNLHESNVRHVVTIWFDAWRYAEQSSVVIPLLWAIEAGLNEQASIREKSVTALKAAAKAIGKAGLMLASGFTANLSFVSQSGQVVLTPEVGFDASKAIEESHRLSHDPQLLKEGLAEYSHALQGFQESIECLENEGWCVVVFVDDLDRLSPEKALSVLESIKLGLAYNGIVFVLGMDSVTIEKAVRQRYGIESAITGAAYIKKIIQAPLPVPLPNDVSLFVNTLTTDPAIRDAVRQTDLKNPREIKRLVNQIHMWNASGNVPFTTLSSTIWKMDFAIWRILENDPRTSEWAQRVKWLDANTSLSRTSLDSLLRNIRKEESIAEYLVDFIHSANNSTWLRRLLPDAVSEICDWPTSYLNSTFRLLANDLLRYCV